MNDEEDPSVTAFQLNTQALFNLQQGEYKEAINKLLQGTARLRIDAQAPTGFHLTASEGYGSQADYESTMAVSITTISVTNAPSTVEDCLLLPPFEWAFESVFWNYEGVRGMKLTWAFILYNLGLCYHHQELRFGTMNDKTLRTALHFYGVALRVMEGALDDGDGRDTVLLVLSVLNNMGHLYSHFGDLQKARHCVAWMRSFVCTKRREDYSWGGGGAFHFFNTTVLSCPDNVFDKAPAA